MTEEERRIIDLIKEKKEAMMESFFQKTKELSNTPLFCVNLCYESDSTELNITVSDGVANSEEMMRLIFTIFFTHYQNHHPEMLMKAIFNLLDKNIEDFAQKPQIISDEDTTVN